MGKITMPLSINFKKNEYLLSNSIRPLINRGKKIMFSKDYQNFTIICVKLMNELIWVNRLSSHEKPMMAYESNQEYNDVGKKPKRDSVC